MADGFRNAIGAASGDADSVRVSYRVPAGLAIDQRRRIDCTGYESVIVLAECQTDDDDDFLVEVWFYDDDYINAATRGAAMVAQGRGTTRRPFTIGGPENHWIQVPVAGKYMIISVDPGQVSGIATNGPVDITYILSHRKVDKVQGFMAGRTLDILGGLANTRQYWPGTKRYTSQLTLAPAGAADDRSLIYPPCGMGLVRVSIRLWHVGARVVTCYAQSALLDGVNLNYYDGFYSLSFTYTKSFDFINPSWPLCIYVRNHDAVNLVLSVTHTWDDTL